MKSMKTLQKCYLLCKDGQKQIFNFYETIFGFCVLNFKLLRVMSISPGCYCTSSACSWIKYGMISRAFNVSYVRVFSIVSIFCSSTILLHWKIRIVKMLVEESAFFAYLLKRHHYGGIIRKMFWFLIADGTHETFITYNMCPDQITGTKITFYDSTNLLLLAIRLIFRIKGQRIF